MSEPTTEMGGIYVDQSGRPMGSVLPKPVTTDTLLERIEAMEATLATVRNQLAEMAKALGLPPADEQTGGYLCPDGSELFSGIRAALDGAVDTLK